MINIRLCLIYDHNQLPKSSYHFSGYVSSYYSSSLFFSVNLYVSSFFIILCDLINLRAVYISKYLLRTYLCWQTYMLPEIILGRVSEGVSTLELVSPVTISSNTSGVGLVVGYTFVLHPPASPGLVRPI